VSSQYRKEGGKRGAPQLPDYVRPDRAGVVARKHAHRAPVPLGKARRIEGPRVARGALPLRLLRRRAVRGVPERPGRVQLVRGEGRYVSSQYRKGHA